MKTWKVGILTLILVALDLLTKYLFFDLKIAQEFLILEPVFNTGISRGIAANLLLVILISFFGLGIFIWLWTKKHINNLIFILFLAGTLGNLGDRIFLNGVRDFISIGSFPVFNLADCFLTLAVVILLRKEIFPCNREKKH